MLLLYTWRWYAHPLKLRWLSHPRKRWCLRALTYSLAMAAPMSSEAATILVSLCPRWLRRCHCESWHAAASRKKDGTENIGAESKSKKNLKANVVEKIYASSQDIKNHNFLHNSLYESLSSNLFLYISRCTPFIKNSVHIAGEFTNQVATHKLIYPQI